MIIRDRTEHSPEAYRMRPRRRDEIRAVVLHQTGFEWDPENSMWDRVRAHLVVLRSGVVLLLHPLLIRMRFGCGEGNREAINVECEGNLPLEHGADGPVFWKPEVFGRSTLAEPQITAARELLTWLQGQVPGVRVGTHRQIELDRSGCCGPDIWREVGQYAVDVLNMSEMPTRGGRDIPDSWRQPVSIPYKFGRECTGPLEVSP